MGIMAAWPGEPDAHPWSYQHHRLSLAPHSLRICARVLTGLLNIVPVLGAAVCIALALLVAAIDSWGRVLGIAIFYVIYLQVENSSSHPTHYEE